MGKKMSSDQWIKACKKMIDADDRKGLRAILGYLDEVEAYLVWQAKEIVLDHAALQKQYEALEILLKNKEFQRMGSHAVQAAVNRNDPELLKLALKYTNPNALIHISIHPEGEERKRSYMGYHVNGINYYVTAEPLGACAILGRVELAKILLDHGAKVEGATASELMEKKSMYLRPFLSAKMEILLRWERDNQYFHERFEGVKRIPPWAYAMFCKDTKAAEYFLSLGEDRYSLELAMAMTMVQDSEIIRILQEKKPELMKGMKPEYILRRFWPEAVKQYFSSGREIPGNAVQFMGQYLFDELDLPDDLMSPVRQNFRETDFVETLAFLMKNGYGLTREDMEYLTYVMVVFQSEKLFQLLKGKIPSGMDVSQWIELLPVEEKEWEFGGKLAEAGIRFRCVLDSEFTCRQTKRYMELVRLFKLVDFQVCDPQKMDQMTTAALLGRSKRSMALLWKQGLITKENLSQAVKLICDLQLTELYEFSAELAGTTGGSEVRYEL